MVRRLSEDERIDDEPQRDQRRVAPAPRPRGHERQRRACPARPRTPRIAVPRKYRAPDTRHGWPPAAGVGALSRGRHDFESALVAGVSRRARPINTACQKVAGRQNSCPQNRINLANSAPCRRDDAADSRFFRFAASISKSREPTKADGKLARFPQVDSSEHCASQSPVCGESEGSMHRGRPIESSQ